MPTTLASNDRVARHLWRDRAVARSGARGRAPGLDAPVRPVLGTPVLGPPVSGASLARVLSAGVLRLAPRPPVVVTPLPRSHGDRLADTQAANPPSSRVPLSFLQGEVPPSTARPRPSAREQPCLARPNRDTLCRSQQKRWKKRPNQGVWRPTSGAVRPHWLRSAAVARARRCPAPDAADASYRRPARRGPPGPCSPHRPPRARSSHRASAPALPRR